MDFDSIDKGSNPLPVANFYWGYSMDTERVRFHKEVIKGYISSFENYPLLNPMTSINFTYFGHQWETIIQAYNALSQGKEKDSDKIKLMGNILYSFFLQNEVARNELFSTKQMWIENKVDNHDNFWHNCKCPKCFIEQGLNYYGRLLMEVRDRLIWEEKPKHNSSKRWQVRYF